MAAGSATAMQWRGAGEGEPCRFLVSGHLVLGEREFGRGAVPHPVDREAFLRETLAHARADHRIVLGEEEAHQAFGLNLSDAEFMQ